MNRYALIIPSFENNIGFKLAALDTYLKHKPSNMDIFFVYGGRSTQFITNCKNGIPYTDVYVNVPENITSLHKKIYKFFRTYINTLLKDYTHFLKIDDDTFIYNIDTFANHKISGDYVGNKIIIDSENEQHVRNKLINVKNYKVRETYNGGLPDAFCSGECYMLSRKAAKLLISYKGSKKRTRFGIEDIFVGYILQSQKVKINQNKFINYEHPVDIEKFHKIYQTHYNPVNIKSNE
jgi:hypothetical protein